MELLFGPRKRKSPSTVEGAREIAQDCVDTRAVTTTTVLAVILENVVREEQTRLQTVRQTHEQVPPEVPKLLKEYFNFFGDRAEATRQPLKEKSKIVQQGIPDYADKDGKTSVKNMQLLLHWFTTRCCKIQEDQSEFKKLNSIQSRLERAVDQFQKNYEEVEKSNECVDEFKRALGDAKEKLNNACESKDQKRMEQAGKDSRAENQEQRDSMETLWMSDRAKLVALAVSLNVPLPEHPCLDEAKAENGVKTSEFSGAMVTMKDPED